MSQTNLDCNSSTNLQALPPFPQSQLPKSQKKISEKNYCQHRERNSLLFICLTSTFLCCALASIFFLIDFFLTCMMDFAKKKGLLVVLSSAYQNNYDDFY